jgi:hypothetical protein
MLEKRFAILIGINDYNDRPLSYCANDVIALQNVLIDRCGFEKNNIKTIISTKEKPIDVTFELIKTQIELIQNDFGATKDTILFYFSGHGIFDEEFKLDLKNDDVVFNLFFDEIKRLIPQNLILIIDACHSGFLFELKGKDEITLDEYWKERYKLNTKGFYFLAACDQNESAKAYKNDELSKYTKALIETIKNDKVFESGKLPLESAHSYAALKLVNQKIQNPHLQLNGGGFIISDKTFHKSAIIEEPIKKTVAKMKVKTSEESFEESMKLIQKLKLQLKTFSGIIRGYIFKDYTGNAIFIDPNSYKSSMNEAIANRIIDADEDGIELNHNHKLVETLFNDLNKLEDLYNKISDPTEFLELFETEFELEEFDLSNKEVWERIFETKIFFD